MAKCTHALGTSFAISEAQLSERQDAHTNYVRSFSAGDALWKQMARIGRDAGGTQRQLQVAALDSVAR